MGGLNLFARNKKASGRLRDVSPHPLSALSSHHPSYNKKRKMEIKNVSSNLESLKKQIKEISIDLVPSKRQSQTWNKCFRNTARWIDEKEKDLAGWDKAAKESIAVAVCNGAVYEPKPKMK